MTEAMIEVALATLRSLIQKEIGLFLGVDREMRRLSSVLSTIKAVLEDAEEKQLTNKALNNWLHKLQDAAHLLDDILDECSTHALSLEYPELKCGSSLTVQGSCFNYLHPSKFLFRYKIAEKLKDISERIDEIAEERLKFHLCATVRERRNEVMEWRQTTSIITQPQFYGREAEKEKIVDFLVGDASNLEDVSVYPLIGIGGLGKTTLAQHVFNDERVVNHFELRIWVCVSEDFNLKRLSKAIIESAGHACRDLDLEPLQRRLQEVIGRKKYLLVLDDVWNDNQEKWDKLKYVLACGSKGASILVTTRLSKVACITGTVPSHQLSLLSEDDCWELFRQRAFGSEQEERRELVAIGKEIVKKCKGVPLAAKTLGSLLRFHSDEKEWLRIKESEIWNLPQEEESVLPALRLSYLNLPTKLRRCFAFCALFPKDQRMSKKLVIELWMANGFISSNESVEAEDDGDRVWNELYLRSFFNDIEVNGFGYDTLFYMHDLVHDLAQSAVEDVCRCITSKDDSPILSERTRHISFYHLKPSHGQWLSYLGQIKSLKTCINIMQKCDEDNNLLMRCHSLRALDMLSFKEVSSAIGQLKHLRYLNLSCGSFKTLPNSICRLHNLQILNLNYCQYLEKLPNQMECLKSLRHLYLDWCRSLSRLAPNMGQLTCLKTLNTYIVGTQNGFLLAELRNLKLKGTLHIRHLERLRSVMDAKEANLADKHLTELVLSWERNEESPLQENDELILEDLQPHSQLKILSIGGYFGTQFPQWMGNPALKYLSNLELVDCKNCFDISPLEKLPSLTNLSLSNLNLLQYVDNESYNNGVVRGFTTLKFLLLEKLPNLVKLSRVDGDNMFPCLSTLQTSQCPKLILPCLPSVTELKLLKESNGVLLGSIQNLRNLECLWFIKDKDLISFPNGMLGGLVCLKELHIHSLDKLEVLPTELGNLNALEELHIAGCKNLKTLAEQAFQGLYSLKRLRICGYTKFKLSAGFQYLAALEDLTIAGCPEVKDLPEALQHIVALQSLKLYDLPNLALLPDWLGNLRTLKSLVISNCPRLMSLPMSIQSLSSLKELGIYGCPDLVKRCKDETGEDWPKIAHVSSTHFEEDTYLSEGNGYSWYHLDYRVRLGRWAVI
ncbi:putative disease resistance protein RGA3 [Neltuma alba]|uniref:putative disease resistance protein RGA3 n=1 Tax=Neltuma alba TaxID=207710 RepID=UPI0010A372DD|nr:putative disease resistance protein RGA3 [Prosopis alba]